VAELLVTARGLPDRLSSPRLAMESAIILRLAERLTDLLRAGDPLAGRVALTRLDFALCGLRGVAAICLRRLTGGARTNQPARQGT
jgi:hypothetical protein